jgi:hypothetical protein
MKAYLEKSMMEPEIAPPSIQKVAQKETFSSFLGTVAGQQQ